jgi:hypothetical protein
MEVEAKNAIYCPYCSKPLRMAIAQKRSGFPTASGVLTIIGASISLLIGIIFLINAYFLGDASDATVGVFGILAFSFGLTGGILTLKRKVFVLAIIGICFVIVSSILTSVAIDFGFIFGLPVFILSTLGLIFTAISKKEFG